MIDKDEITPPRAPCTALIELGQALGYPLDDEGCCHGVCVSWLEAGLLGAQAQQDFEERMTLICSDEPAVLVAQIHACQEKVKQHLPLTEKEQTFLSCLAFYEKIELHLRPVLYAPLFNRGLEQSHVQEISSFTSSQLTEAHGGLKKACCLMGTYTKESLTSYLGDLKRILKKNNQGVGILLSSSDHTMTLQYKPKTNKWILMDINQYPPVKTIKSGLIAKRILDGFRPDNTFSLTVFTLADQQNPTALKELLQFNCDKIDALLHDIEEIDSLSSLALIAISSGESDIANQLIKEMIKHKIAIDLAVYPDGDTLLLLACEQGDLPTIATLLSAGANPNVKIASDPTHSLLHIAGARGHFSTVMMLLDDPRTERPQEIWVSTPSLHSFIHHHYAKKVPAAIEELVETILAIDPSDNPITLELDEFVQLMTNIPAPQAKARGSVFFRAPDEPQTKAPDSRPTTPMKPK